MMRTSLQDADRIRRLAASGAFLVATLMLSLAESIAFPAGFLPIPGAKLGLANGAVLLCATVLGPKNAAAVSLCRVLLMFILFGNASSVLYSVSGAVLSFIGIALFCRNRYLSFLGKSVIAAVLHNIAQVGCAALIFGYHILAIAPWMILAAILSGCISGTLLNLSYRPVSRAIEHLIPNTK